MMNCSEYRFYQKFTSQLVKTVAYVFTDIPYFFIKIFLKLLKDKRTELKMILEYGKSEA